jgi:hypothetical protein
MCFLLLIVLVKLYHKSGLNISDFPKDATRRILNLRTTWLLSFGCMKNSYNDQIKPSPLPHVCPTFISSKTWKTRIQPKELIYVYFNLNISHLCLIPT